MDPIIIETCTQINILATKLLEAINGQTSAPIPVTPKTWRDNYFNRKEVSEYCEVSERVVYNWIQDKLIVPSIKIGGRSFYDKQYIYDQITNGLLDHYKAKPPAK
jgi:hypothetical protein